MGHLQGKCVARLHAQQLAQMRLGQLVVIVEHRTQRSEVLSLKAVERKSSSTRQNEACRSDAARITTAHQQVGLQRMGHHEARRFAQRLGQGQLRPGAPGLKRSKRSLVGLQRASRSSGHRAATRVDQIDSDRSTMHVAVLRQCVGVRTGTARGAVAGLAPGCLRVMDVCHIELQWCRGDRPDDGSMPEASLAVVFGMGHPPCRLSPMRIRWPCSVTEQRL